MSLRTKVRAFTLLELAVVLAILGVAGAAMGMLLIRQQRFYRGASELLYAREGVRDALEVLAGDLRGIAVDDTVRLLADSAIEIYSSVGSSVACQVIDKEVGLPRAVPSGNTLSAFVAEPDTGDLALFYRATGDGSSWEPHRIGAFSARVLAAVCPASSGFSSPEDIASGAQGFQVTLDAPLSADIRPGAPVRFIRRGRYSLYRASDGSSYLGYRRCNAQGASSCGAVQPLSGPYRAYSANPAATGLLLEYFDDDGHRLTAASSSLSLARVDVTARSESNQRLSIEGHTFKPADSATVSIAIRNRLP
ncbi:MAG TPA: type II secretion system protein [Gemmatimonadaceae bacterium]|jgi:prepilin-type N-terminal cleavage/methylation domain-containing protein|nr:type II secretion system protein [Gemmatimonadaceae bacterium]